MKHLVFVFAAIIVSSSACTDSKGACSTDVNCMNTVQSKCLHSQTFTKGKECKDIGFTNESAAGIWHR